jgi:hypothetical protein
LGAEPDNKSNMKYSLPFCFCAIALLLSAAALAQRAPDYNDLHDWSAFPGQQGAADSVPAFLTGEQRDTLADVFYIYPTTFITEDGSKDLMELMEHPVQTMAAMRRAPWNADMDNAALNRMTDLRPVLFQATAFNACCRMFAPRYRQANLKAFIEVKDPKAGAALDLAYTDVRAAFQYYLEHENHGRPIVIAAHSQGSRHAIRLLQEFFDGRPLQKQLVCAYVIGYQIKKDDFKQIPLCADPKATGCVVTWRTFQHGEIPAKVKEEDGNAMCINPLTWSAAIPAADSDANAGAILADFNKLAVHFAGAEVEPSTHILWVDLPPDAPSRVRRIKNLHVFDYNLFWMNIRQNARLRVNSFLGR